MSRKNIRPLSQAEWHIMEALWGAERAISVRDVLQRLYPEGEKAYTTVQTIMNILVDKGYLGKEKIGMVNFYTALVPRDKAVRKATDSLVSRIFHGSFGALATYLVDSDALLLEELEELKALIDKKERKSRGQQGHD